MMNRDACTTGIIIQSRSLIAIYIVWSLLALFSLFMPFLADLAGHGKTRQDVGTTHANNKKKKKNKTLLESFAHSLVVPKRWFWHFYLFGLVALILQVQVYYIMFKDDYTTELVSSSTSSISLLLLTTHLTRRLYECQRVHQWKPSSSMHVMGYLLGLLHYLLLPLVVIRIECESTKRTTTTTTTTLTTSSSMIQTSFAVLLNLWAQYQQYRHHCILADTTTNHGQNTSRQSTSSVTRHRHTRSSSSSSKTIITATEPYRLPPPHTAWFQYLLCPHYTAEILIYTSLALLIGSWTSLSLLVWVTINLSVSAHQQSQWYRQQQQQQQDKEKPKKHRYAILPGIL